MREEESRLSAGARQYFIAFSLIQKEYKTGEEAQLCRSFLCLVLSRYFINHTATGSFYKEKYCFAFVVLMRRFRVNGYIINLGYIPLQNPFCTITLILQQPPSLPPLLASVITIVIFQIFVLLEEQQQKLLLVGQKGIGLNPPNFRCLIEILLRQNQADTV